MVCGCLFGWQSVMYQFCDLNLISRIILSGAYLIHYLREESQICFMDTSLDADMSHTILGHSVSISPILFDVGIPNLVC